MTITEILLYWALFFLLIGYIGRSIQYYSLKKENRKLKREMILKKSFKRNLNDDFFGEKQMMQFIKKVMSLFAVIIVIIVLGIIMLIMWIGDLIKTGFNKLISFYCSL